MPRRIQRRRVKGWRMPDGAKSVTRPGRWGNPFRVGHPMDDDGHPIPEYLDWPGAKRMTAADAVRCFRTYARGRLQEEPDWLEPLRGADLACYCAEGAEHCHADVLLELANR